MDWNVALGHCVVGLLSAARAVSLDSDNDLWPPEVDWALGRRLARRNVSFEYKRLLAVRCQH